MVFTNCFAKGHHIIYEMSNPWTKIRQQHQLPKSEQAGWSQRQASCLSGLLFLDVPSLQSIHAKDCSDYLVDAWFDVDPVQ